MLSMILLAIMAVYILKRIIFRERSDLDKLPVCSIIELLNMNNVEIWAKLRALTKQHDGRYVIKGFLRTVLHTSRPDDIEALLCNNKNITKSKDYSFLIPWLGNGLLLSTGEKWQKRRKILTPTFHFNILKNFATVIEEKTKELINDLMMETKGQQTLEIDVVSEISDCTLFAICETAMGTKLSRDCTNKQRTYKKAVRDISFMVPRRIAKAWHHFDFLYNMLPIGREFQHSLKKVIAFADDVIAQRKKEKLLEKKVVAKLKNEEGTKTKMAMLDLLIEAEIKGEIDPDGIREEVNTFIFEGHDTTAMVLVFILLLLAQHKYVQDKLLEEIESTAGDPNCKLTSSDLADMKYLDAVLKEGLRMYPSVPTIGRYITEDFQMGDFFVKKGTEVVMDIYDMHHREDLFEDPEVFRPERFLNYTPRHAFAYVPFSAGPRNCIGQRFALLETKRIVTEIVRKFELSPSPRTSTPRLQTDLVLRPADSIYLNITKRGSK